MIDFPASPTNGQTFTSGGQSWLYDGTKWLPAGQVNTVVVPMGDNRLVNGDMRIDQRNNGAAGTVAAYTVDRWQYTQSQLSKGTWQRGGPTGATAPGFPYSLSFQSSSAYALVAADYFLFQQKIEADLISDFQWGTASAQPVTLSFWVLIGGLTGTFGGSIQNGASNRSYPFTFSIPVVNTWTRIVLPIPGDTAGTWTLNGNGVGLILNFNLGTGTTYSGPAGAWAAANYFSATGAVSIVSTNGAGLWLTGVKLEIGSVATPFNRQSLAKSLADCQRYYCNTVSAWFQAYSNGSQNFGYELSFPTMRAAPTVGFSGTTYANASGLAVSSGPTVSSVGLNAVATAGGNATFATIVLLSAEL